MSKKITRSDCGEIKSNLFKKKSLTGREQHPGQRNATLSSLRTPVILNWVIINCLTNCKCIRWKSCAQNLFSHIRVIRSSLWFFSSYQIYPISGQKLYNVQKMQLSWRLETFQAKNLIYGNLTGWRKVTAVVVSGQMQTLHLMWTDFSHS